MKKSVIIISIVVFVAGLVLAFLPKNQVGKLQVKGDYEDIPYENHSVLVKYTGTDDVVKVPEVFNAKPVTMIADSLYSICL